MNATQLMLRYQEGDYEAFDCLYEIYKSRVYGYIMKKVKNRIEADEIFQTVFLKLHQFRSKYDGKFPFDPWLFTILRNSLMDHQRKKGRSSAEITLDCVEENSPELQVGSSSHSEPLVPNGVDLTTTQKKAVELRYGEDFSFEEIAAVLETTPSNVRQLISRALRKMREVITPGGAP